MNGVLLFGGFSEERARNPVERIAARPDLWHKGKACIRVVQGIPIGYPSDTQGNNTGAIPEQSRAATVLTPCSSTRSSLTSRRLPWY